MVPRNFAVLIMFGARGLLLSKESWPEHGGILSECPEDGPLFLLPLYSHVLFSFPKYK